MKSSEVEVSGEVTILEAVKLVSVSTFCTYIKEKLYSVFISNQAFFFSADYFTRIVHSGLSLAEGRENKKED